MGLLRSEYTPRVTTPRAAAAARDRSLDGPMCPRSAYTMDPRGCRSGQLGEDDDEGQGGEHESAGQVPACSCVQCGGGRRFSPERGHRKPHGGTYQQRGHGPPHTATLSARRIAGAAPASGSAVTLTDDRWRRRAAPLRLLLSPARTTARLSRRSVACHARRYSSCALTPRRRLDTGGDRASVMRGSGRGLMARVARRSSSRILLARRIFLPGR